MSLSNELKKVGKFQDWETMILDEVDGKVCFAQTKPILQAPKSNKRESKLFVTFRPNDKISDEISITPGYEFNKSNSVTAVSGKYKFKFDIKQSGFALITDNKIEINMFRQMKRGSRLMITGYNEEGSQTIDHD